MEHMTEQDKFKNATAIFHSMIASPLTERYKAVERMDNQNYPVDLPTLKNISSLP